MLTQENELRTQNNYSHTTNIHEELRTQLETALCIVNCFCNTELRTATVTKIKGLPILTQLNMFVLFTLLKITLDERKTLTKNSRTISQCSPNIVQLIIWKEEPSHDLGTRKRTLHLKQW